MHTSSNLGAFEGVQYVCLGIVNIPRVQEFIDVSSCEELTNGKALMLFMLIVGDVQAEQERQNTRVGFCAPVCSIVHLFLRQYEPTHLIFLSLAVRLLLVLTLLMLFFGYCF